MKPKNSTLLFLFICLAKGTYAFHFPASYTTNISCAGITCTTSNGIYVTSGPPASYHTYSVQMTQIDSITLTLSTPMGCSLLLDSLIVNGTPVNYVIVSAPYGGMVLRLLSHPGNYHVYAKVGGIYPNQATFTLQMSPVGLAKLSKEDEERILLFPNPVQNRLNITSKRSEIKTIRIIDSIGRLVGTFDVHQLQYQLPMDKHPAGMYFIYVTTESEKTEIRKITVL